MKLDHYFIQHVKINSKRIQELNVRTEIIKFLGENLGSKPFDVGFGDDFLDLTQKAKEKTKNK